MTSPAEHANIVREARRALKVLRVVVPTSVADDVEGKVLDALEAQAARVEELEAALRELLDGSRVMDNPMNTVVSTSDIEDARDKLDKDTA